MNKPKQSPKQAFLASILKKNEHYAGIILGKDGAPDHHLILLPGQAADVTFQQAKEFAINVGGDLPTSREQSLLLTNLKEEFEDRYYWSGEQHDSDFTWFQNFDNGYQGYYNQLSKLRARAVRRVNLVTQ